MRERDHTVSATHGDMDQVRMAVAACCGSVAPVAPASPPPLLYAYIVMYYTVLHGLDEICPLFAKVRC